MIQGMGGMVLRFPFSELVMPTGGGTPARCFPAGCMLPVFSCGALILWLRESKV